MTVNGPKTRATADVGRLREELTSKDVAKYTVRHPGDGDVFMKVQNAICCYTTGEPVPNVVAPPISLILVGIQPPVYLGACFGQSAATEAHFGGSAKRQDQLLLTY